MKRLKMLSLAILMSAPLALGAWGERKAFDPNDLSGSHTIRILNLEDYIYVNDPDEGYTLPDLVEQFEEYANDKFGLNDVRVVYETSDTNESEYNDLALGRVQYDLVCTSDYMLQKLAREGLIERLSNEELEYLTNYNQYSSVTIKERIDQIPVQIGDETVNLREFAVGYMWGTLGMMINPEFGTFKARNISIDQALADAQSWDILWNNKYYGTASIKNSMRDTYAVALMHGYDKELQSLKDELNKKIEEGTVTEEDYKTYNKTLEEIFNLVDDKTLNMVSNELFTLRQNIFGLEVDSGKQDIVMGKIGINLAWSGDAVYSMDLGEEAGNPVELYYSIPENGSNIWFDGWAIPTNKNRDAGTKLLALEFLNFISDPLYASMNMDYTGYTSFIGGDDILDLVRSWYDAREDTAYYYDEDEECYTICYIDPITQEETEADYSTLFDVNAETDPAYDDVELYYYVEIKNEEDEDNPLLEKVYIEEEGERVCFNDWFAFDYNAYYEVDLGYFFNGSFTNYEDNVDSIFYTDCYLYEEVEGNVSVGRQFFCQYPDEATILRCAVMRDYGDDNIKVVKLWEASRSGPLPTWAIVTLVVIVGALVGFAIYHYVSKRIKKSLRLKRQAEKKNNIK